MLVFVEYLLLLVVVLSDLVLCIIWLLDVGFWCYLVDFFGLWCGEVMYVFVEVFDYCDKYVVIEYYEFGFGL